MKDSAQFGNQKSKAQPSAAFDCAAVEQWLAESAEKTLSPQVEEQIRHHAVDCISCNEKLAQARKGREWLLVLKQEALEPPADLVAKILARTSLAKTPSEAHSAETEWRIPASSGGQQTESDLFLHGDAGGHHEKRSLRNAKSHPSTEISEHVSSIPLWRRSPVLVLRRTVLEPRLALVAAMAFFSISLSLNLMGIRLGGMRASDLTPNGVRRMVTRQYADANARVVRYYENLRVVYEVESRVQQIRRDSETPASSEPAKKPRKQSFNFHPHTRKNPMQLGQGHPVYRLILDKNQMAQSDPDPLPIQNKTAVEAELRQISKQERQSA